MGISWKQYPSPESRAYRVEPADWRIAPSAGLGLSMTILRELMELEIDTAGQLWDLFETAELTRSKGFSVEQGRRIERALIILRDGAGDPVPRSIRR